MRLHPERSLVVLVSLMSLSPTSLAQYKPNPTRPRSYLESWQDNQIRLTKSTTRLLREEQ